MQRIFAAAFIALLLSGCGRGAITAPQPSCAPNGECAGTYYLAAAEPSGIALFAAPYSGAARASVAIQNAESFTSFPTVDTPATVLVGVPPDKLYSFDYPYASPGGSYTIPVRDISKMGFFFLPAQSGGAEQLVLLVADAVNNDLALVSFSGNSPSLVQTVTGLDRPGDFAVDLQNTLWVAETSDIALFTMQGGVFTRTGNITSGLSAPDGLYRYYDGSMYVADAGSNSIVVFPPNSVTPAFAVSNGLNKPRSIVEAYGNTLFVANAGNNTIAAFTLPLTPTSTPLWINHNLSGTPRALTTWFSPSF